MGAGGSPPGLPPVDVLEGLAALAEHHLVRGPAGAPGEPGGRGGGAGGGPEERFAMLETVREYAAERLEASGEADACRRRHAHHLLELAERAAPELRGPSQAAWLDRLEAEHDNLRAALAWGEDTARQGDRGAGRGDGGDGARLALRLGVALWRFWWARGHLSEGWRRLNGLLALPRPGSQPGLATGEGAGTVGDEADGELRAEVAFGAGVIAVTAGEYEAGRAALQGSLARWRAVGDEAGVAYVRFILADADLRLGAADAARAGAAASVATFRRLGEGEGLHWALLVLALAAYAVGDRSDAGAAAAEAAALFRDQGEQVGLAEALLVVGVVAEDAGDRPRAADRYRESLAVRRDLGEPAGLAQSLEAVAGLLTGRGQRAAARAARLAGAAAAVREAVGVRAYPALAARLAAQLAPVRATLGGEEFGRLMGGGGGPRHQGGGGPGPGGSGAPPGRGRRGGRPAAPGA